jgi:hypothetical protein
MASMASGRFPFHLHTVNVCGYRGKTMPGDRLEMVLDTLEMMNPSELVTLLGAVQAHLAGQPRRVWCTHQETLKHLGVHPRTLKRAMAVTPEHIQRPWIDMGSKSKAHYRWDVRRLDRWWEDLNQWRASTNGRQAIESVGGTQMGAVAVREPRISKQPVRSRGSLKRRQPKGSDGNLVNIANALISKIS